MSEQDKNTLLGIQNARDAIDEQRLLAEQAARLNAEMAAKNAAYAERQLGDAYRAVSGKASSEELKRIAELQQRTIDAAMERPSGVDTYLGGPVSDKERYKELERQRAIGRLEQLNVLNRSVSHADAATLVSAVAGLSQEVEAMARQMGRLDELVRSLLDSKAPFTDDDVAAIKAHVRHPGALEAAKLRETVRCLRIAADNCNWTTVSSILGGLDAEG